MQKFWLFSIDTYLTSEEKRLELEEQLNKIKWDIISLSEVHRKNENIKTTITISVLFYKGYSEYHQNGGRFLINKQWYNNVVKYVGVIDRIAYIILLLGMNSTS